MGLSRTMAKMKADELVARLRQGPDTVGESEPVEANEPTPVDQEVTTEIPVDSPAPDQ